jgi:hypothetical protein
MRARAMSPMNREMHQVATTNDSRFTAAPSAGELWRIAAAYTR